MNPNIAKIIENINKGIIPEGYKKTKVGIVPVEWEVTNLGEKAHIETGSKNTQDKVDNGKYPFFVRSQTIEHIDSYSYDCEAVITAGDGVGVGKVYHYINGKFDCHQRAYIVNKFYNALGKYIFFYVSNYFYHRVMKMNAKNSVDSVRMEMLSKMPIPFPPLPEQQKIAEILSTQDKLIELYERKIEQLKTLKKGYLQKMFPKKGCKYPELRFKGFTEPWEQRKLNSLTLVITKGTTPLDKSNSGTVNFIKVENIDDSSGEISISQKISAEEHKGYLKRSQLKENDILFSIAGTLGRVTSVHSSILPANTNQALAIIRLREGNLNFIKTFLKSQAIANYIKRNPTVGAQPNLSLEQVSNLEIQLPNIQEQQFIGDYFKSIDNLITLHQHKLDKEKQKKKALMQLLLTGKVRVST